MHVQPQTPLDKAAIAGLFKVQAYRAGRLLWEEWVPNLIVNEGLDYAIGVSIGATTKIANWFVGLKGAGAPAAGDTMASHAGWTEVTAYTETARQAFVPGAVSAQTIDSTASPAVFTINAATTVAGLFLASDSTKGGTTGSLWAAVNFAASRDLQNEDEIRVSYSAGFTAS
jgi:hypothetical protein